MLFSIVIPTWNRRLLLRETLASVWAQSCVDYEVIVVDSGSTDGTLEDLEADRTRLTLVRTAEPGPGASRNAGLAQARGDYVAFLDSDDVWFPWTLATIRDIVRVTDAPSLVAGAIRQFHDPAELGRVTEEAASTTAYADFLAAASSTLLVGSGSVVVRRDVAVASGGFTTLLINGEDHDWLLKVGTAAGFVAVDAPATLGWRRHSASATANLSMSISGAEYLVDQERRGQYPGGAERTRDRRIYISRQIRPVSMACLEAGELGAGWTLYVHTFFWHCRLLRLRYLIAFPLAALARGWRRRRGIP